MTCKEKFILEHPDMADDMLSYCPHRFSYMDHPVNCNPEKGDQTSYSKCAACWNREMPESDEHVTLVDTDNRRYEYSPSNTLKDSGDRTEFESGAVRDMRTGKGRCDLMPLDVAWKLCKDVFKDESGIVFQYIYEFQQDGEICHLLDAIGYFLKDHPNWDNYMTMFLDVAKHFEDGCEKYGENNWRKGIPAKVYLDSAVRHYLKWVRMDEDEPHDRAFVWNLMCCIWTCIHKPELNNYARSEDSER